jgi:hypothetical protein
MRILPTAEAKCDLDLVTLLQKILNELGLEPKIVFAHTRRETHFFQGLRLLRLAGLSLFASLLVFEPPIIQDLANWRLSHGTDLDEVHVFAPCHVERTRQGNDPELFTVLANKSYFTRTDLIVDSKVF